VIRRVADAWLRVAEWLALASAVVLIALSLPIAYDVVGRKLSHPTSWAFDVSLYLMVTLVYLATAHAIRTGNHFRVHIVMDRFPRFRRWFDLFDYLCIFIFGVLLAVAGGGLAWTSFTTHLTSTTLLATPMFLPQLALPIGGIALALEAIALAFDPKPPEATIVPVLSE
jgi:TRAP-type C4-dicarboxylate transport system permease small subunit